RKRATTGRTSQLTLTPSDRKRFKAIQAVMVQHKGVTGGRDGFQLRELANEIASVEVNWKYGLDQLCDRLEELHVAYGNSALGFEVTEQSANRITVRVVELPAAPDAGASPDAAPGE
ncbi:MAG: hypothetical protein V3T70_04860, partial [Phycisphaerae bacterium]